MSKTLVIVESPAKAKTIGRFLGRDYEVVASFGHVRDLPESAKDIPEEIKKEKWARLGVNVEDQFQPIYIVPSDKKRRVTELRDAAKGKDRLLLATDEDREGESISWHVLQLIKPKKGVEVKRIVFHEITPEAIEEALANPRTVDENLVRAQETRRVLDRLFGYTLSPLLWKKVAPGLSAGRVQSVAVRLIVIRERERRDFVIAEYAGIAATVRAAKGQFDVKLDRLAGTPVASGGDFDSQGQLKGKVHWLKSKEADDLAPALAEAKPWRVVEVEKTPGQEHPPAPFMTSTLQQEANRKFGWAADRTMRIAQQLYEGVDMGGERVGLITYMRTDSLALAERAVKQAREVVTLQYGAEYLPKSPRVYKSKAKNAQEAHEAIRPTDLARLPADVKAFLTEEQAKLYDLVWKRTLASQMKSADVARSRVVVETELEKRAFQFVATGKEIVFPGFLRAYVEGADDPDEKLGDRETILPEVKVGDEVEPLDVRATLHSTRPPARYTEATLIRTLENEGVGRPSTYASIIKTIQDRGYVVKRKNELVPTWTAMAVTHLLEESFPRLVNVKFTAELEDDLDEIAEGELDYVNRLKKFYHGAGDEPGIEKEINEKGREIPFPHISVGDQVVVRIGRNGPFLQRGLDGATENANLPEDLAPADLTSEVIEQLFSRRQAEPEAVGTDPETGRPIYSRVGRYGPYLERPGAEGEDPKRVTIPPGTDVGSLTPEELATLISFPRTLGLHPETKDPVVVAVGKYGAYLTAGEKKANVGDWKAAAQLDLEQAVAQLAAPKAGTRERSAAPAPMRTLGTADGLEGEVRVMSGRYGPYVTDGKTNATLPKNVDPEKIGLEDAAELIRKKKSEGPKARPKFKRRR
jgi:DNA topoisomerase I